MCPGTAGGKTPTHRAAPPCPESRGLQGGFVGATDPGRAWGRGGRPAQPLAGLGLSSDHAAPERHPPLLSFRRRGFRTLSSVRPGHQGLPRGP